jgi:cysteine desulfurase
VAGIAGFGEAVRLLGRDLSRITEHLRLLGDRLEKGLIEVEDVSLNGHPRRRLPGLVNVSVRGVDGESLLLALARRGIAASSGSSCFDEAGKPSHVLTAMGATPESARGSVLFAAGPDTTGSEIDRVLDLFPDVVASLRAIAAGPE